MSTHFPQSPLFTLRGYKEADPDHAYPISDGMPPIRTEEEARAIATRLIHNGYYRVQFGYEGNWHEVAMPEYKPTGRIFLAVHPDGSVGRLYSGWVPNGRTDAPADTIVWVAETEALWPYDAERRLPSVAERFDSEWGIRLTYTSRIKVPAALLETDTHLGGELDSYARGLAVFRAPGSRSR